MNKKLVLFLVGCITMVSACNENKAPGSENVTNDTMHRSSTEIANPLAGCYTMITGKDTALLQLDVMDSTIAGKLQYQRFEKDDNTGELTGIIRGSQIIADYIFNSEGRRSVRDVVFLIKGDSLFEGYGEIKMIGDTARFLNPNDLKYLPGAFTKVACK